MMMDCSVIAIYDQVSNAEAAMNALNRAGFPVKHASFVSQNFHHDDRVHGFITTHDDHIKGGAITGAWVGGVFGLLTGVAFLAIPGFGPLLAAGHIAAVLLGSVEGAAIGAAGGGFLAALTQVGVTHQLFSLYETALKDGKCMIIAHGSPEEVAMAGDVLSGTGAMDLRTHVAGKS